MSEQVRISDEAFLYLKKIQFQIYEEKGIKRTINDLVSKAILNNVESD